MNKVKITRKILTFLLWKLIKRGSPGSTGVIDKNMQFAFLFPELLDNVLAA
jgi:hypothetical protein